MVRETVAKLVTLQEHRIEQIQKIGDRMRRRTPDTLVPAIVQLRITAVEQKWAEVTRTHEELITRPDAAEHEYITENRFDGLLLIYETTIDWLHTALSGFANEEAENLRRRPRAREDADEQEEPFAKLPRLDLPTFSGDYEEWDSFADQFASLVGNCKRLSDGRKLQYLKSCLKGPAFELVKQVKAVGIHYASTWESLRARFYNPRLKVNRLLDSLFTLPYLQQESAAELRAFVDNTQRIVRALNNLGAPVADWDMWLVHLIESRADAETRKMWVFHLISRNHHGAVANPDGGRSYFPRFEELTAFLEMRAQALSIVQDDKQTTQPTSSRSSSRRVHHAQSSQRSKPLPCAHCSGDHAIWQCQTFIALKTLDERRVAARAKTLCFNCLGRHSQEKCGSTYSCKKCGSKEHHTLLHPDDDDASALTTDQRPLPTTPVRTHMTQAAASPELSVHACGTGIATSECSILLATAQVLALGPEGKQTRARVLLDQGSEASFVSESLVQLLGLHTDRVQTKLTGVGGCKAGVVRKATTLTLQSRFESSFQVEINAFVLPKLTSQLPSRDLIEIDLDLFRSIPLADPEFHFKDRVDIMVGADVYSQLLRQGIARLPTTSLIAQNTALGWIVSGPTKGTVPRRAAPHGQATVSSLQCSVNDDLSDLIQRYWTIEEVLVAPSKLKPADEACENLFVETHTRGSDGRFTVRLPLASDLPSVAAETRRTALGSLKHQHRRFAQDSRLASSYTDFMDQYLKLGHMEPVPPSEVHDPRAWYLPHHAVVTGDPICPKVRVVFDASRRTRERHCLNEFLMSGPPLQNDHSMILLNWRRHRYVFTADIVKMFRQIRLALEDQDRNRIVWSSSPAIPVTDYRLTTVTYGTACAPYLAIRTLLQLASDERARFPLGAACLETETYVDDTFSGADELATAIRKRDELVGILKSAGIELDKWAANHSDLLPSRTQSNDSHAIKNNDGDSSVKALGVHWNPSTDSFSFSASKHNKGGKLTKRVLYSEIARLFDPLGWLAPITVIAKIIMQDLWIEKWEWDVPLSNEICERWHSYCESLSTLPDLSIDRWLGLSPGSTAEIHGFSDASSRAYAAAVYLRVTDGAGNSRIFLLSAKTKPSPVKTVSIPNLELCGATLLVKLVRYLQKSDFLKDSSVFLWSDSQIVLTWLKEHPCHWKTFVANRVSMIQTELPAATWSHVPTKQNPADLATRGATPQELQSNDQWWHGPAWLASAPDTWLQPPKPVQALHVQPRDDEPALLTRYSTLDRLTRITAWCLRPLLQFRRSQAGQGSFPSFLTPAELDNAQRGVILIAQAHAFPEEIALLQARKTLSRRNSLQKLTPFLDTDGILRVRGRLSNANLPLTVKHPPILPRRSALSQLFVRHAHKHALHGGPTLTLSTLLRHAWIIGMRALVKTAVRKCVKCQRHALRLAHQLLGNLPSARVTPSEAFSTTGLDYAGPFNVRTSKNRGVASYKGYIALFVCFATKAVHLEVVSDLTSASFIAAFRRFAGRRVKPKELYSDNATTFRGADAELRAMFTAASDFYKDVASKLAGDGTLWTFIPPTTPHYGGLWEAGVKSTKNLLNRTIGDAKLTYEELSTVLVEIKACLNSRPLCPFSSTPDDLRVLTSAHLLGTVSGLIPDAEVPDVPDNRLDRFQRLQRIRDQFWKLWSNEYVLLLQERAKWRGSTKNFAVGQLVLLRDDRYPPSKWPLGRVIEVHPGADDLVRVVTVKTATNTLRRHIACLAPLTLDQPEESENSDPREDNA